MTNGSKDKTEFPLCILSPYCIDKELGKTKEERSQIPIIPMRTDEMGDIHKWKSQKCKNLSLGNILITPFFSKSYIFTTNEHN